MFGGQTLGKILDSLRQYLPIDLAQNMENNYPCLFYGSSQNIEQKPLSCFFDKH